jgi:nitroimidazol reductase NimA-like FMN-containing flavoprotein (pyridoxamine 5'-phosphate oxidase superfamily)
MKKIQLDDAARDAFLADRRLGILAMLDAAGAPIALPLWYRWDGHTIEMFSERKAPKVGLLEKDPRVSLLVTNIPPEPARWVSLEGRVAIDDGGQEAGARLAARYLEDPTAIAGTIKMFRHVELVRLSIAPDRIRSYAEIY